MNADSTIDMFGSDNALAIAKRETMEKAREKGCKCPVCDQFVKIYRRKITSAMAYALIKAYHTWGIGTEFHITDLVKATHPNIGGDFAKLRFWGLVREAAHYPGDEGKRKSGLWTLTPAAGAFVRRETRVPHNVFLYDNVKQGTSDEQCTIDDCLGNKFDYNELMRGIGSDELTAAG